MHEMSLAESVLEIVEDCVRREGCLRVKTVRLEIGRLSSVEPAAMRFCFEAVARGTLAEGASLDIVEQEGRAWCFDCGRQVPLAKRCDPCAACGGFRMRVKQGEAMRVKELELE
ncbi:MAG TPA: hydrogenase maturation nickel metallochaperone HypA [Gallionella sp.]|nr:hydrogenase maturation nickel metallochaperone HypA [Gallionella sp.]